MNSVDNNNPLSVMLDNVFSKVDSNKDNKLDADEYKSFYEVLKAGIATNDSGKPYISDDQYFQRMDHDADGGVTREEVQTTGVIMPADLCDVSLDKMIDWLKLQKTTGAQMAAQLLASPSAETTDTKKA
jgi:hypothetical protein